MKTEQLSVYTIKITPENETNKNTIRNLVLAIIKLNNGTVFTKYTMSQYLREQFGLVIDMYDVLDALEKLTFFDVLQHDGIDRDMQQRYILKSREVL